MSDPFVGEIRLFTWNWNPKNWALCDGSLINIQQYPALYALLGTRYGGDGITTFCLPDLRGRVPIGVGPGVGGSTYVQGAAGGTENVTLTAYTMPNHNHLMTCSNLNANSNPPRSYSVYGAAVSGTPPAATNYYTPISPAAKLVPLQEPTQTAPSNLSIVGGNASHSNIQPSLVLNYCIATSGLFPPRP
jgi:microcystin-dependent protein